MRFLVADDHPLVRQGICALLKSRPDWEICGEATDGRQAVQMVKELKPHIAILDIAMPNLNGLDPAPRQRQVLNTVERCAPNRPHYPAFSALLRCFDTKEHRIVVQKWPLSINRRVRVTAITTLGEEGHCSVCLTTQECQHRSAVGPNASHWMA
jgi:CheY-like chemotaxis protein